MSNYSTDLMRDSVLPSLIRLKGNLSQLSNTPTVPFDIRLAIKSLAHDANDLDDLLHEYLELTRDEGKK